MNYSYLICCYGYLIPYDVWCDRLELGNSKYIMGRWQSGQLQRTVNPPTFVYEGSNPSLPKLKNIRQIVEGAVAQLARAPALHAGG